MESQDPGESERQQVAAAVAALRRAMRARLDSGLLPYDGRWVTLPELEQGIRSERRRAWVHAIELILLFVILLAMSSFVYGFLVWLVY